MKKIILYIAIAALVCTFLFGLYSLNHLLKEKRIIKLLTNDSCKYWIFKRSPSMGKGYCQGDTTVSYYKTRNGERVIKVSPANWLIGDIGFSCKWKYLGDSIIDEDSDKWKLISITEDTLIRMWERWGTDTLIYDR